MPFFWPSLPKPKRKMRKPPFVRGGDKRISKPLRRGSVKILGLSKSLQVDTSHIKGLHDRAEDVASRLGTDIPSSIERHMWSLPILEKMLDRIEELEKKCGSQCLQQGSCSVDSQSPGSTIC